MNKKAVFFDVDGTLWDAKNHIPPSAFDAVRLLRENGVLTFINSGRCRGYIRDENLLSIGFDGIVSGCGTMIELNGKEIFYHEMSQDLSEHSINLVRSFGFRPILEGKRYLYMDDEEFKGDLYSDKVRQEMGENLLSIKDNWRNWEISKFSCATENCDREACYKAAESDFDFMIHNEFVTEFVPRGFHKGTGILKVCELLDIDINDTYAVGDSPNDRGMLETAGHAIVMGNGHDDMKAIAEYVTDTLHDDGIFKAMKYYELI